VAWLLPLGLIYTFFYATVGPDSAISSIVLFFIILVTADLAIALLNGFNDVYEHRPTYTGASIAAYIDLIKVLAIVAAIFFSLALFTDIPPMALLTGLGAWLAVLLLIFRDTILNFLASIQISSQDMVKDGDWIEVPSYGADGTVVNVSLNSIKVKNADMTTTMIPTYKIVDVAFKNYRGVAESGGRRLKASLVLDLNSLRFCDLALLRQLSDVDLIAAHVNEQISQLEEAQLADAGPGDLPLDGPQITNVELFRKYTEAYLRGRKDLRQRHFTFIVRILEPISAGLPLEIYVFTKKTDWTEYVTTKGEIMTHLLAAAPYFDLRVFPE
jgi:miniconductance mechanosensitive channel